MFVGRDKDLEQLHVFLQQPDQDRVQIVAITGMGGIGKTKLAKQYAHRCRENYTGGIWLIEAQGRVEQVLSYGRRMKLEAPDSSLMNEERVHWYYDRWLEEVPVGKRLLIFDDVLSYEEVALLLPQDSRFSVLLTTRVQIGKPIQRLDLSILDRASAFRLLRRFVSNDTRIAKEVESAKKLCDWVGRLPLGIELIGRHLANRTLELSKLLKRLEKQKLRSTVLNDRPLPEMSYKSNLESAFELNWQLLDDAAKQMSGLLSLFAPVLIDPEWIKTCLLKWDEEKQEGALSDLTRWSFISLQGGQYLLHPLIREFFSMKLESELSFLRKEFLTNIVSALEFLFPETRRYEDWLLCSCLHPHVKSILVVTKSQNMESLEVMRLLNKVAYYLFEQAQYKEARLTYYRLYFICKQNISVRESEAIDCLNGMVEVFEALGKYDKAERFAKIAIELIRKSPNPYLLALAKCQYNLGMIYEGKGKYFQAEKCLTEAQLIQEQELGTEGLDTARTYHYLGKVRYLKRQYAEAEAELLKALNIRKNLLGENNADVVVTTDVLASVYIKQGKYDEAEKQLRTVLKIKKTIKELEHPYSARSWNSFGILYCRQGNYSKAEESYKKSIEIWERYFKDNHPDEGKTLSNLAGLLCFLEKFDEAEQWYQKSLRILEQKLGRDHPDTATVLFNYGFNLFFRQQKLSEAEEKCLEAIKILREIIPNDLSLAEKLCHLADIYLAQESIFRIQPLYYEAIKIYEKTLGMNAIETVKTRELYEFAGQLQSE